MPRLQLINKVSILHPLCPLYIWPQAVDHLIVKRDEMKQSFAGHAGVGLFSRWRAYRVIEEPLCQPSIYLALLEMASYELWVREKVEGTFLAFHAHTTKRKVESLEKIFTGQHYGPHVMIAHAFDSLTTVTELTD